MKITLSCLGTALLIASCSNPTPESTENNQTENSTPETQETMSEPELPMQYVVMETTAGTITLELDPNRAPVSVANFLKYVDSGHYDGTIFHRVISNFMIQGGGFTPEGKQKSTMEPIMLESKNGLGNDIGTIAMARTNDPNSATCQFFINVAQNDFLNYAPGNAGYAVFGKVSSGMEVVNEIRQTPTGIKNGMPDWPQNDVVITKMSRDN